MKAIITGGAGFIGSNLTSFLLKKGWKVLVIDNFSVGSLENLPKDKNLRVEKANICNRKKIFNLIRNSDYVFHLAVQCVRKSINDPFLVHRVNAEGTLNVLEASRKNKVKRFVYVSSSEVYGTGEKIPMDEGCPLKPMTVYGASKLAGENYTLAYWRTYGYPSVVVRPFNTYGYNSHFNGMYGEVIPRFLVRALNNKTLQIFGSGKQTRDFTFVDDTVRGIYLAAKKGKNGKIYNIARGEEVSVNDIAKAVLGGVDTASKTDHLEERPGDVLRHFADIKKAERELGFKPRVDMDNGIKMYIKWFTNKYSDPKSLLKKYEEKNW